MAKRLFQVPAPLLGDEDHLFVSFCIPNSPGWRRLVVGHIEALTYGRNYDEQTGYIKAAQAVGREIFESMSMCKLDDIIKQQRMLTAAIVGESVDLTDPAQLSPDAVDFTAASATPGLVPSLQYLQNLQTMGTIPGEGDTIQATLWDIRDGLTDGGKTLDDWIGEMQAQEAIDPDYSFKDWLEMLLFIKQLVPNFGGSPLAWVMAQYKALIATRHAHTHSTLMAYQATELRAIRNALAPFEEATDGEGNVTEDEESLVKSIISDLDKIPWLTTAIGSLVDPSPAGETAMAIKIGLAAKNLWDKLTSLYQNWMNLYINQVETLQPKLTVSGMIAELSKRLRGDDEDYGTTGQPATIFGALQTIAWTQVTPQDEIDNPGISTSNQLKVIADALAALDADMPEGSTWPALFGQIAANIANIKLSCSCGGSGGGCGACGGGDLPSAPGIEGDPPPDGWVNPTDSAGDTLAPGSPAYQSRKCKVANIIHENIVDFLAQLNDAGIMGVLGATVGVVVVTTMVFAVLGELLTPVPLIDGLLGALAGAVASLSIVFLVNTVDLAELISILNANEEDLVCALYNAPSTSAAATNYQAVVQNDPNFTIGANVLILEALLLTNFVNVLFFDPSNYSETLPSQLEGYTGPVDCGACGDLTYIHTYCGVVQGAFVSGDFNTVVVVDSVATPSVCTGPNWQFVGISPNGGGCLHFEFNVLSGSVEGISWLDCNGVHQSTGVIGIDSTSVHLFNSANTPFRVEITISTIP